MQQKAKSTTEENHCWELLLHDVLNEAERSKSKICLCGSLFGGTGASGLPTIGEVVTNRLISVRSKIDVAAVMMLPYFGFQSSKAIESETEYADSRDFLLKTEAALNFYYSQIEKVKANFDAIYLLGGREFSEVDFHIGWDKQNNPAHYLELYAGLAIQDFYFSSDFDKSRIVRIVGTRARNKIAWEDIPKSKEVREHIRAATIFAYSWLSFIQFELKDAREVGIDKAKKALPWITLFFGKEAGSIANASLKLLGIFPKKQSSYPTLENISDDEIDALTKWCVSFLSWLVGIHTIDPDTGGIEIQLVNIQPLKQLLDHFLTQSQLGDRDLQAIQLHTKSPSDWPNEIADFGITLAQLFLQDSSEDGRLLWKVKERMNEADFPDIEDFNVFGLIGLSRFLYQLASKL